MIVKHESIVHGAMSNKVIKRDSSPFVTLGCLVYRYQNLKVHVECICSTVTDDHFKLYFTIFEIETILCKRNSMCMELTGFHDNAVIYLS